MKIFGQQVAVVNGRQFVATTGMSDDDMKFLAMIDFGKVQACGEGITMQEAINDIDFKCRDLDKQYGWRVPA